MEAGRNGGCPYGAKDHLAGLVIEHVVTAGVQNFNRRIIHRGVKNKLKINRALPPALAGKRRITLETPRHDPQVKRILPHLIGIDT